MEGETHTELIPLSSINKVPITFWSGLLDQTCSNVQAKKSAAEIGERVTYFRTVPWAWHTYWGGPLTNGLFRELKIYLTDPETRRWPL